MLAEALKLLFDNSSQNRKPIRLDASDDREDVYAIDGQVERVAKKPKPRTHSADTLADLVSLANRFKEAGVSPVVWYGPAKVVLVIDDDGYRVETSSLQLAESDVFQAVRKLSEASYDQKSFVRLLRITLAGTLEPRELLEPVRKVKFTTNDVRDGEIRRDRSSMGREITAECKPDVAIPEDVVLKAPVYKTPGENRSYPLNCAVDVDPLTGRFQLIPRPDEIERVVQYAVDDIAARLGESLTEGIPFYQGRP